MSYWGWWTPHHWIASVGISNRLWRWFGGYSKLQIVAGCQHRGASLANAPCWARGTHAAVSFGGWLRYRKSFTGRPGNLQDNLLSASHQECYGHCNLSLSISGGVNSSGSVTEVVVWREKCSDEALHVPVGRTPSLENKSTNVLGNQTSYNIQCWTFLVEDILYRTIFLLEHVGVWTCQSSEPCGGSLGKASPRAVMLSALSREPCQIKLQ